MTDTCADIEATQPLKVYFFINSALRRARFVE